MWQLIIFGLIGSAFFSTSFVLYELMSVQGGHWFWSASLRCLFMWLLCTVVIWIQNGFKIRLLTKLIRLFNQHFLFWSLAGSIGLGTYGWLAFGADFAPAWVITSTFLFTVVASLFVLAFFGQRFRPQVIIYALIIFFGIILANLGEGVSRTDVDLGRLVLFGALPALMAAFCFPIGNQLLWQAVQPTRPQATSLRNQLLKRLPHIDGELLKNPFHKVWLLSAGSLPAWIILSLFFRPPTPSISQISMAFLVALLAGVLGTSVFLYARGQAKSANMVAGVDATQAAEIIFALIGGMILLGTPLPSVMSSIGIVIIITGLGLFANSNK